MAQLSQFSLTFSFNTGDEIEVWGHSPGVTTDDWISNPNIDPYYVYDKYTASSSDPHEYSFMYDVSRGYVAAIYVNGSLAARRTIDPVEVPSISIDDVIVRYHTITIYFSNASQNDHINVYIHLGAYTTHTAEVTYSNDGTAIARFEGLTAGTLYEISVYVAGMLFDELSYSTEAYPSFQWDTTIESGAEIAVDWSTKEVSPITATEWNRFLDIYGLKTGTTYTHVSKGDSLSVKSETTMRKIADNLGVDVSVGEEITAQFFIDLKNALNELK